MGGGHLAGSVGMMTGKNEIKQAVKIAGPMPMPNQTKPHPENGYKSGIWQGIECRQQRVYRCADQAG